MRRAGSVGRHVRSQWRLLRSRRCVILPPRALLRPAHSRFRSSSPRFLVAHVAPSDTTRVLHRHPYYTYPSYIPMRHSHVGGLPIALAISPVI
jgi:hypothetical protein